MAASLADQLPGSVTGWTAWHRRVDHARVPGVRGPRRLGLPRRALIASWEKGRGPRPVGADVVHAPTLLAPPRTDKPLVVTIHDAVPWSHPETLTTRGVRWHRKMAERVGREADAIVVPTRAVADELVRHVQLRREPHVIGLGVTEFGEFDVSGGRAASLGLPAGGYVLSLSTLEPRKGLDVLIAAMAHPGAPQLPLVVVGAAGWGGVRLPDLAGTVGLAPDRVVELGAVSDVDLGLIIRLASVLVVPSRSEGFGLPVLEGMAMGVPVVTSDAAALVEVGGGATVVAPVGDVAATAEAMTSAVTEGSFRESLVALGLTRSREFSWSAAAESLVEVYQSVL